MMERSSDSPLIGRLFDTLGLNAAVSEVAVRMVREHDAAIVARVVSPTADASVVAMLARGVAKQADTISALGDQILELSKK